MVKVAAIMARKKRRASATRRLHRSLGAGGAVFIIFLALSGIAINHSNFLGLDKKPVSQGVLLDWYGLEKPEKVLSYRVADQWLSFAGSQVFLNEQPVSTLANGVGAVPAGDILVVAGSEELFLIDSSGQLIERQRWEASPADPIRSIGSLPDGTVSLKTKQQIWLSDRDFIQWTPVDGATIKPDWAHSEALPATLMQTITQSYRGHGLNLERVLLDLHSGRFFGGIGVLIYDLVALILGFLAVSGLTMWFKSRRIGKRKSSRANYD